MNLENNGIIVINKPKGLTSRDVVNIMCRKLKTKKIGHTGTLDPLAEGVLVLCVGRATKLCELLTSETKEYVAKVVLGINTDTLDITGTVLNENYQYVSKKQIENTLKKFKKTYMQEVPIYSAVKVKGKKLYEYARNNEKIILPKKEVTIYDISLLEYNFNEKVTFTFKCTVSKGTYIRSLIRDIAGQLNTYATMTDLKRTRQGKFKIEEAIDLESNSFNIIPIIDVLDIPQKIVSDTLKKKIINGQKLENEGQILYLDKNKKTLAIYKDGKVLKMLYNALEN